MFPEVQHAVIRTFRPPSPRAQNNLLRPAKLKGRKRGISKDEGKWIRRRHTNSEHHKVRAAREKPVVVLRPKVVR